MDIANISVIVVNISSPVTMGISGLRADQKQHAFRFLMFRQFKTLNVNSFVLTDGAEFFVTAVTVAGFADTPPATILRPGAVALTRPGFDTSATCD